MPAGARVARGLLQRATRRRRSGMAAGDRGDSRQHRRGWQWRRRRLRLRWVGVCLAAAALLAAIANLPSEHRDYVAARLLLDAVPNPPFHFPAPAAKSPAARTIQLQLDQPTTTATTATTA
jgi:hypothetical protein